MSWPTSRAALAKSRRPERPAVTAADHGFARPEVPPGTWVLRKPEACGELRTLVAAMTSLEDA